VKSPASAKLMRIVSLMENTCGRGDVTCAHGLSLYIELACGRRILMDMGPDDGFIQNAQRLGIDLEKADTAILSHAHRDHTGGLESFLKINRKARVYLREGCFGKTWHVSESSQEYIGPDEALKGHPRLIETGGTCSLGDGMLLFSEITGRECRSEANSVLCIRTPQGFEKDDFSHEQALLIEEGNALVLIGGCAHTGVLNQLSRAREIVSRPVTHLVSGLHLHNPRTGVPASGEVLETIAQRLTENSITCYTCHCTGMYAYERLKEKMGDRMQYLACGDEVRIG